MKKEYQIVVGTISENYQCLEKKQKLLFITVSLTSSRSIYCFTHMLCNPRMCWNLLGGKEANLRHYIKIMLRTRSLIHFPVCATFTFWRTEVVRKGWRNRFWGQFGYPRSSWLFKDAHSGNWVNFPNVVWYSHVSHSKIEF